MQHDRLQKYVVPMFVKLLHLHLSISQTICMA